MSSNSEQLIKELTYQLDEQELRRRPEQDRNAPINGSDFALARSAGAYKIATTKPAPQDHLERDGCQLIDSNYLLLDYIELPAHLRETVIILCGLSGGVYRDYTPITQKRIAQRMGVTIETARERVEELISWQIRNKKALVYVRKNDRKQGSVEYNTTEYLPIVVHYAAEYIRRIKAKGLPPVHHQKEINEKTEKIYEDIGEQVISEMPTAQVLIPRKLSGSSKNVTPKQASLNIIENAQEKIVRDFLNLKTKVSDQSYSAQEIWEDTLLKAEKAFFG